MLARNDKPKKPPVRVAEADYERLWNLASDSSAPGAALLRQELERATVVKNGQASRPFVRLHSKVEFADLQSGRVRTITLVEPGRADMDADRLSVLAPAGAALIGLSPGDTFSWTTDGGRPHVLVVNSVAEADEPAPSTPADSKNQPAPVQKLNARAEGAEPLPVGGRVSAPCRL